MRLLIFLSIFSITAFSYPGKFEEKYGTLEFTPSSVLRMIDLAKADPRNINPLAYHTPQGETVTLETKDTQMRRVWRVNYQAQEYTLTTEGYYNWPLSSGKYDIKSFQPSIYNPHEDLKMYHARLHDVSARFHEHSPNIQADGWTIKRRHVPTRTGKNVTLRTLIWIHKVMPAVDSSSEA